MKYSNLIPQIWMDTIIESLTTSIKADIEILRLWNEEEERRIAEDPEYAARVAEWDRQWIEEQERLMEEYEPDYWW